MHHYEICESSDGLSLRYVTVCSCHRAGLEGEGEGEGEGEDGHPRRRLGIRGTRTFVSLARPGVRAWFLSPQPDEDAFFQEGRSVERDVLETHPNPRYPQVRATLRWNWARATIRRLARNAGPGGSGFRLAGQWGNPV